MTRVGALLDAGAVHPSRSARSHLRWLAQSNGIPRRRADEALDLVGLTSAARRRAGALSLGMRQRLGVAAALLGDPPILILDEPTNGLDPEGILWMRETLRGFAAEGRTVFVSSHLMSELEDTADHLIVIGRGRLLADVSVGELIAAASGSRVEVKTPECHNCDDGPRERRRHRDLERARPDHGPGDAGRAGLGGSRRSPGPARRARVEPGDSRGRVFPAHPWTGEHTSVSIACGLERRAGPPVTATVLSEWTKLRTQRGTLISLLVMCLLMIGMTALFASQAHTDAVSAVTTTSCRYGLAGAVFAQLAAVVAGASLVTAEYASGMIRTTLTATPRRVRVLAAKALVLAAVTFPPALLASAVSFMITQPLLQDGGFVAPAYPPVSITDPSAARAVVGTGLLLTAYALIALGIGTIAAPLGRCDRGRDRASLLPVPGARLLPGRHTRSRQTDRAAGGHGDPVDDGPDAERL